MPIESWYDDPADTALPQLLPFLEGLVGVEDVRPVLRHEFRLHQKVARSRG